MEEKVTVRGITGKLVTSRSNGEVVSAAKLADGKHRRETGAFLCEGEKLFEESFLFGRPERVFLRLDGAENLSDRTAERLADPSLEGKIVFLSGPAFDQITTERAPEGIICVSSFPEGYGAISPEEAAAGAAGKTCEVNTGAIARKYRTAPYPAPTLLSYIREKGGKLLLASDAHSPQNIAFAFDVFADKIGR